MFRRGLDTAEALMALVISEEVGVLPLSTKLEKNTLAEQFVNTYQHFPHTRFPAVLLEVGPPRVQLA